MTLLRDIDNASMMESILGLRELNRYSTWKDAYAP